MTRGRRLCHAAGAWLAYVLSCLPAFTQRAAGVALSPGVFFEAEGYARISYSVSDEQLALGLERLVSFVAKLRG